MRPFLTLAILTVLTWGLPARHLEAQTRTVEIREWTVPWERTRPRDPFVDGSGRVWFVGQEGNYIAHLDTVSGKFTRFEIPAGTHPHNLIVDTKGMVWYAGNRAAHIGRLNPADGKITRYDIAGTGRRDPHTLVFDGRGDIWFTMQGDNSVGHLRTSSGEIRLASVATPNARPYGIVVDKKGRVWFNEFGSDRIARIDTGSMAITEYPLTNERARGRRIATTSDGRVWYVDYTRGFLGALDPETGKIEEFASPAGAAALPYAMTVDDRDRIWYVETGVRPNQLIGFDTRTKKVVSNTPVGSGTGANTVRHMIFHAPSRTLWFGTDANTIGRARVP